jgi:hypothetical protein
MPGVSRIVAGVSGSPGSLPALSQAADLARHHDAILISLHAWVPPEGDVHERTHPCPELRQLWEQDAWQRHPKPAGQPAHERTSKRSS